MIEPAWTDHAGLWRAVVAIPVKNEAARIRGCLEALAGQRDLGGRPLGPDRFAVLLLLNDCHDGTAEIAAGLAPDLPFVLRLLRCSLPPAERHAGGARRRAMDAAARWLGDGDDGLILTTDADTRAAPDWITRQLMSFQDGIGAVAGHVVTDATEDRQLPPGLRRRERLERRYALALSELDARLDPIAHDPWPCHRTMAGASIGVTRAAYRAVGGLPTLASGEDRAFDARLRRQGIRVRHALDVRVVTSCRLVGRASNGMAETLRRRLTDPSSPCDDGLETALDAAHRAFWRATLRRWHATGEIAPTDDWAAALELDQSLACAIAGLPRFGMAWSALERLSPALRPRPLAPDALAAELLRARRLLGWLRDRGAAPIDRWPDLLAS